MSIKINQDFNSAWLSLKCHFPPIINVYKASCCIIFFLYWPSQFMHEQFFLFLLCSFKISQNNEQMMKSELQTGMTYARIRQLLHWLQAMMNSSKLLQTLLRITVGLCFVLFFSCCDFFKKWLLLSWTHVCMNQFLFLHLNFPEVKAQELSSEHNYSDNYHFEDYNLDDDNGKWLPRTAKEDFSNNNINWNTRKCILWIYLSTFSLCVFCSSCINIVKKIISFWTCVRNAFTFWKRLSFFALYDSTL